MTAAHQMNGFIEKLLEEKGLGKEKIDADVHKQLKADLMEELQDLVNSSILQHLPPAQLSAFEELLDSGADHEKLQAFCGQHIPKLSEILAATLITFRDRYLGALATH